MNAAKLREIANTTLNIEQKVDECIYKVTQLCMQNAVQGYFQCTVNLLNIVKSSPASIQNKVIEQTIKQLRKDDYKVSYDNDYEIGRAHV